MSFIKLPFLLLFGGFLWRDVMILNSHNSVWCADSENTWLMGSTCQSEWHLHLAWYPTPFQADDRDAQGAIQGPHRYCCTLADWYARRRTRRYSLLSNPHSYHCIGGIFFILIARLLIGVCSLLYSWSSCSDRSCEYFGIWYTRVSLYLNGTSELHPKSQQWCGQWTDLRCSHTHCSKKQTVILWQIFQAEISSRSRHLVCYLLVEASLSWYYCCRAPLRNCKGVSKCFFGLIPSNWSGW